MTVRGDVHQLDALRHFLNDEAGLRHRMLTAAAGEAKRLVQEEFRTSTDPDGKPWEDLKSRKGMPLRRTGRMLASFDAQPTDTGFRIGSNVSYVKFHQQGTKGHKKYERQAHISEDLLFVRASGKARVTVGPPRTRNVWRKGQVVQVTVGGRKELKYKGVHAEITLHFQEGGGKIPIRRIIPENGQLTPRWQQGIDRACNAAMMRAVIETGGHL